MTIITEMKKIYATYRMRWDNWLDRKSPSYYINNMYKDHVDAWLVIVHDMDIGDEQYTWELIPWVKNMDRFLYVEYNDTAITEAKIKAKIESLGAQFGIDVFPSDVEARAWLDANTNLAKKDNGVTYIVCAASVDENGQAIEEKTITVN